MIKDLLLKRYEKRLVMIKKTCCQNVMKKDLLSKRYDERLVVETL